MQIKTKALGIPIFAVALATALVASCALEPTVGGGTAALNLRFAIAAPTTGSIEQARVWVYLRNVLIPNASGGTDYHFSNLTGGAGTVTIENLPPGNEYHIVAVVGTAQGASLTDVTRYGTSSTFTVNSGVSTNVSLDLSSMSVGRALSGYNVKSVVVYDDGATISAATATTITDFGTGGLEAGTLRGTMPGSHTINSLSVAYGEGSVSDRLLVNGTNGVTTNGVIPVGIWAGGTAPNVLQSGGFLPGGELSAVYFFQSAKGFGGLIDGQGPAQGTWVTIDLDVEGLKGRPVLDFFVTDGGVVEGPIFGYFATRVLGAFRVDSDFIEDSTDHLASIMNKDHWLRFFEDEPSWGKNLPTVQAFGYAGDVTDVLYVGTKNGVYRTLASFGPSALSGPSTLVPGTRGLDITKIATNPWGAAFMAASDVVVLRDGRVYRLSFLQSLVGTVNDIAWDGEGLLVAGSSGLVRIDTTAGASN